MSYKIELFVEEVGWDTLKPIHIFENGKKVKGQALLKDGKLTIEIDDDCEDEILIVE